MSIRQGVIATALVLACAALAHAQETVVLDRPFVTHNGPATVTLEINAVRYSLRPPWATLPQFELQDAAPVDLVDPGRGLESNFMAYHADLRGVTQEIEAVTQQNEASEIALEADLALLAAEVRSSDGALRSTDPAKDKDNVANFVGPLSILAQQAVNDAQGWRSLTILAKQLVDLRALVESLPERYPGGPYAGDCSQLDGLRWKAWHYCMRQPYANLDDDIDRAQKDLAPWMNERERIFADKAALASYWLDTLSALKTTANNFKLQNEDLRCGASNSLKITMFDRASLFGPADSSPEFTTFTVQARCWRTFTIAAGAAFHLLQTNNQFGIVPSSPGSNGGTSEEEFQTKSQSTINPYVIVMGHVHLYDLDDRGRYALHGSFGVGPSLNSDAAGGNSAEFLTGGSISLRRVVFVTVGCDVKKMAKLGGGFAVGDQAPQGLTTPPVTSAYKAGLGIAITFTKP